MTLRENVTAVIESCFSEAKEEIQEIAINRIMQLVNSVDTPRTEKSNSEYYLELADAVMRGEMSDASANQAWYEYINKQDTPQTELPKQIRTPYEGDIKVTPQTDCGWK